MKQSKINLIFVLSSVFILSLFVVLGFFATNNNTIKTATKSTNESTAAIALNADSIKQQFNTAINNFDNRLSASLTNEDSALKMDENKLLEYEKLKNEISSLLKDSTNIDDLQLAKRKIQILEIKIEELRGRNNNIEEDNRRLNAMIVELLKKKQNNNANNEFSTSSNNNRTSTLENKSENTVFSVNSLSLVALNNDNNRARETNEADNVAQFTGSVWVKNNANQPNAELYVVLQQPDGEIIKNSDWESGLFQTKEGKRKVYSLVLRFDYSKGENKQCNFSLNTSDLPKGKYILQVYHKGILIANATKLLS